MALNKCAQLLNDFLNENNIVLKVSEVAELREAVEAKKLELESQGKSFDSLIKGNDIVREKDVFFQSLIEDFFENSDRKFAEEANKKVILNMRMLELETNTEHLAKLNPNKSRTELNLKAWKALIFNSGDTFGHQTLEGIIDANTKIKQAMLAKKISDIFQEYGIPLDDPFAVWTRTDIVGKRKEIDPITGVETEIDITFQDAVIMELFDMAKQIQGPKGQKYSNTIGANPVSGSKEARAVARAWTESIILPTYYETKAVGRNTSVFDNTPKITFKKWKIKKLQDRWIEEQRQKGRQDFDAKKAAGDEAFIRLLADNMSDLHGEDVTLREQLAKSIYNKFMLTGDWRDADVIIKQYKEQTVASLPYASTERGKAQATLPTTLRFRDEAAFLRVNKLIGGETSLLEIVHRSVNESGRLLGLTKFFGAQFETNFKTLKDIVENGRLIDDPLDYSGTFNLQNYKTGSFLDKKLAKSANDYVEHLIHPWISENIDTSVWSSILGSIRNAQIVKLGSAFITNLADMASFWTVASTRIQGSQSRIISAITGHDFKGTRAERRLYASAFVDFAEVYIGTLQDRFRMIDHGAMGGNSRMGDWLVKGSAGFAHITLKYTGFNAWNRTMSIGATSFIQREIGDMIANKKGWLELKPEQRQFFQKFGFSEIEYKSLLAAGNDALDSSGRLNIFGYQRWLKDNKAMYGGTEIQKLISVINDLSETMVIKPGAIDRAAIGFFSKPGSVMEQSFRAITQFKTFLVAHSRKLLLNEYGTIGKLAKNKQFVQATINLAHLVAPMLLLTYAVVQLKQFVAGKEFYKTDDEAILREMFQYTNIIPFLGDLYWQNGGEQLFNIMSLKDGEKTPRSGVSMNSFFRNILGPTLQDFESFTKAVIEMGEAGLLEIKGREREAADIFKLSVSRFARTFQGFDPFANMWMTKALWRSLTYDTFLEYFDPQRYYRTQRRLTRRAMDERVNGELYNFFIKDLGLKD